jgi:hypothetical protein
MAVSYTAEFSEEFVPLVDEHADSKAIGTHTSTYIAVNDYHRLVLVLNVGEMQATATLNVTLHQATDTSGTGAKVFTTSKAITELTQAGGDGDNLICIEVGAEEFDVDGGFDCVAVVAVVADAAVELAWSLFGFVSRYVPVSLTNWDEVVS